MLLLHTAKNTGTEEQLEIVTLFKKIKYDHLENTIPQKQHFLRTILKGSLTMCKNSNEGDQLKYWKQGTRKAVSLTLLCVNMST